MESLFEKRLRMTASEVNKATERRYWHHFGVIMGNCELIQHINFTGCTPRILKDLLPGGFSFVIKICNVWITKKKYLVFFLWLWGYKTLLRYHMKKHDKLCPETYTETSQISVMELLIKILFSCKVPSRMVWLGFECPSDAYQVSNAFVGSIHICYCDFFQLSWNNFVSIWKLGLKSEQPLLISIIWL